MQNATRDVPDVSIVGAGVFGLSAALACLKRGLSVQVLEARHVGAGASGGIVGALSPHVPDQWNAKKQFQFEALIAAQTFWSEVRQLSGHSTGFAQAGRLMPLISADARKAAEARVASAPLHWADHAHWQVLNKSPDPNWVQGLGHGLVEETLSARLMPRAATIALGHAVRALGGVIEENTSVTGFGAGFVDVSGTRRAAKKLLLCAGVSGLQMLGQHLGAPLGSGVKGQAALLTPKGSVWEALKDRGTLRSVYADGLYLIPHEAGTVAVGSTSEASYEIGDTTDHLLDDLIDQARRLSPVLKGAVVTERWAGVRPKARKRDPLLGPVPGMADVFVANGGFKIGFGIAPKVGNVMADMIMGRSVDLPDSFSPAHHSGQTFDLGS